MTKRSKKLGDLAAGCPSARVFGDRGVAVSGIEYDSRRVTPGDLFVAIDGGHDDGHRYLDHAVAAGAAAVMVDRPMGSPVPELVAPNTRATLPLIAAEFFDHPSRALDVIGVTGTDGKTTTAHLLDHILRDAGMTTGMVGTVSVRIAGQTVDHETRQTTPESVDIQRYLRAMIDAGVTHAILEATSHGLDLHRLDETRFAIGAVTNITHEHLEHHGTIENYRRAKAILFERAAAAGGAAVINLDDEGAREMLFYSGGATILTYSMTAAADLVADEIVTGVDGNRFRLRYQATVHNLQIPLVGGFNVANALCAAGVALAAGAPMATIIHALARAPAIPGRMARVDRGQPFTVIVDYAHTPESLTKVLTLLRGLNPAGRLIVVSGSAGERDQTKRPIQGKVCAELADLSIFTTEDPRFEDAERIIDEIAGGAAAAGAVEGIDYHRVTDRREAIERAMGAAAPGDCILLAGKGHERSIIWGAEKRPWNEEMVAREALAALGFGE